MKILAIVLAAALFVAAVVYLLPGGPLGFHVKHAVLCVVLGLLALVWLRFQTKGATPTSVR
jgi:accessory gene regulator protein AgrB